MMPHEDKDDSPQTTPLIFVAALRPTVTNFAFSVKADTAMQEQCFLTHLS